MYMYIKGIVAQQKSYGFKNLVKLEVARTKIKIPLGRTVFGFSSKTSFFAGLGALFGTFLFNFLSFFYGDKRKD